MKRRNPLKDKVVYERKKIAKTRVSIPAEQIMPDKTKYDRKKNTKLIEKEIEND